MRIIVIVTDQEKLTPRSRVIFEKLRAAHSITKFPVFCVQPEASLPCSQESTNWPYPKPIESSPHCGTVLV